MKDKIQPCKSLCKTVEVGRWEGLLEFLERKRFFHLFSPKAVVFAFRVYVK